jgi:hypothetical protein
MLSNYSSQYVPQIHFFERALVNLIYSSLKLDAVIRSRRSVSCLVFWFRVLVVGRQSNNHSCMDLSKTIIYNQQQYNTSKIATNSRSHVISLVFMAVLLGVDSKHPSVRAGFPRRRDALGTDVTNSTPETKAESRIYMEIWRLFKEHRMAMRPSRAGPKEEVLKWELEDFWCGDRELWVGILRYFAARTYIEWF